MVASLGYEEALIMEVDDPRVVSSPFSILNRMRGDT